LWGFFSIKTLLFSLVTVKYLFIIAILIASWSQINGQNLVPNPSFEENVYCPVSYNQSSLNLIENWRQVSTGTPDYFNSCSNKAGVPVNVFGDQVAKSGNAYAGLVTFASSKRDYREYMYAPLTRKLEAGEQVCIEIFVSPADDARFITDGLGVNLSKKKLDGKLDKVIDAEPAIECPWLYFVDGFDQWVLLSNTYTAKGGEKFITIGNFKPDSELNVLKKTVSGEIAANNWAYIYIDSLVVKPIESKKDCSCTIELLEDIVVDPPVELEENSVVNFESVLFDFDRDELTEESKEKLNEVAKSLIKNKNLYIEINGHTDIIGDEGYNENLSKRRAEAVQSYLESKGIDKVRLTINFHGSAAPVAENQTSEGRAQNRRVEFGILEKTYSLFARSDKEDD